jgi:hypothetical protein
MKKTLLILLGGLLWPCCVLAEPAIMSKADRLLEKPFSDGKVLGSLSGGQTVDVVKREGGWYQVKAAGKLGWVRMLSVRRTANAAVASSGSLAQVATGRAGTGQIVATTGVRGLGEETLREAPFSEAAVATAERYRVSPADAERAARAAGLAPRQVPALPVPGGGS